MVITPERRRKLAKKYIPEKGFVLLNGCRGTGPTKLQALSVLAAFSMGATAAGAAAYAGIGTRKIYYWRQKCEAFDEACTEVCSIANSKVVHGLYLAATVPGSNGHINVGAAIFWLKNRARDEWMDEVIQTPGEEAVEVPVHPQRLSQVGEILKQAGVLH